MMTPFELRHLRESIGANLARMAQLLGLSVNDGNKVRNMETGIDEIPGPIQRVAKFMQEGVADSAMNQLLPRFLLADDLEGENNQEWVIHTRYPRFLAMVTEGPIKDAVCKSADGVEWLCVAMWIDEPVDDPDEILNSAAIHFMEYSENC
jgi:hypothetical protein